MGFDNYRTDWLAAGARSGRVRGADQEGARGFGEYILGIRICSNLKYEWGLWNYKNFIL